MFKKFSVLCRTIICGFVFLFSLIGGLDAVCAQTALPAGGSGFGTAVAIQPGTYQGGALAEGQEVYYLIHAKAGQQIKISDTVIPAEQLYGAGQDITLYDENKNELMNDDGGSGNSFSAYWLAGSQESVHNYYLKITASAWDTKSFVLEYSLTDRYDAGSQTDAGDNFEKALSLAIGEYHGYLAGHPYLSLQVGDDQKDYYKISVSKGITYEFKAVPEVKGAVALEMFNAGRELLEDKSSANDGAGVSLALTPSANTSIFLAVSDSYSQGNSDAGDILDYDLSVKSSSVALTKFYNCKNNGCEPAGDFASLQQCQESTAKACYQNSNCDGRCGGTEPLICTKNSDCLADDICAFGQCVAGEKPPVAVCEDECVSGQTKCFDNFNYYKCGDYNNDGCFEWASPVYCGEGNKCDGGKCAKTEGCQCSAWQSAECGILGCSPDKMAKTRTCNPAACDIEEACQDDSYCQIITPPATTTIVTSTGQDWFALLGFGFWSWFGGLYFILWILAYIYLAVCLQVLAKKTDTANGWMAWVPIANIFLMIEIAKKPLWWFILILIPIVNIVIGVILWMAIAERRGKESWLGILIIVPAVGIVIPGYLAFFDNGKSKKEEPAEPYAPTGIQGAERPTVGYKHPCKYCGKLIPPNSIACPFCEKTNPLGPDRCPRCHEPVDKQWKVCAKCNQNLRIVCPFCGKITFFGDHCEDCGARLMVVCPGCGQEQPPIGDNCIKCGNPLKPKQA
jgi:hypothetical protein